MADTIYSGMVRDATLDDAAIIADFNARLAIESESKRLDAAVLERGVRALFERPQLGRYFIAEHEGDVIGQTMITFEWSDWRCGMFWWIQSVYVVPALRRRGVFRALYRHIQAAAQADDGVCGLRLYVERENEAALATYQRMGMSPAGYHVYEHDWSDAVQPA